MTSVDSYLCRVRFWLPARERRRVIQALREDIDDQIRAQQDALGRPLARDEIKAVLRGFGLPALAASRYASQAPLIAAGLMTVYRRILFMGLWAALAVQLVLAVLGLFDGRMVGDVVLQGLSNMATAVCTGFTITTLVFAVLSRVYARTLRQP